MNLILGLFAFVVGSVTLLVRFVLPQPAPSVNNPYPRLILAGWMPVLTLGFVPLLASAAFLGAWWMDDGTRAAAPTPMRVIDAKSRDTDSDHNAPRPASRDDRQPVPDAPASQPSAGG